jgi:hypothetical protein
MTWMAMYSRFKTSTLDCIAELGPAVIHHLAWRDGTNTDSLCRSEF